MFPFDKKVFWRIFRRSMIQKSTVDDNVYMYKTLSNGMGAVLVHNPKFTKSSCALSVRAGSLDEPADCPGLAHFLEHMLFMGTEKYPGESMFSDFLGQHSGYSNAYTADEMTVYYCDVESSQLRQMADMFSSFFISPLFMKDSVQREISAVNSEYLNSLNSREWRIGALLTEFMGEAVPEKLFSCGNAETLRHPDILEQVSNLWKTKYSSDIMNLVVCGNDSIRDLEEMAEMFSCVPNLYLKTQISPNNSDDIYDARPKEIFDKKFCSKIIQFAPLESRKELSICMTLPHTRSFFRTNPLSYIEFLFTSRESGSLLSKLKSEGLGFSLSLSYDHYEKYTKLEIDVDLTDNGSREHVRVLCMIKAFLSAIRADENEYLRLRRLENEEFEYKQSEPPLDLAERLCSGMHFYPEENLLNFDYIYEDFDPKLIDFLVSWISDHSKWVILLADKNGTFEFKEKYYGVEYSVIGEFRPEDCPAVTLQDSRTSRATDCFIESIELVGNEARLVKTETFENGCISLIFDKKFKVPKSGIFIFLRNRDIREKMIPLEVFLRLAEDSFSEKFGRLLTNYHLSVSSEVTSTGILFKFEGFTSKIAETAKLFFSVLQDVPLDRFEVTRQEVEDGYLETISQSPYLRIGEVFGSKILKSVSSEQLLELARCVRRDEVRFLDSFYTEVLAVGNIVYEDVLDLFDSIKSDGARCKIEIDDEVGPITFGTNDRNNNLVAMFYRIDGGVSNELRVEKASEDLDGQCHSFIFDKHYVRSASGRLIHQICNEQFFKELRTQEELGYVVGTDIRSFHSAEYLVFFVQSERSVEFLESRIRRFVLGLAESIKSMSDDDFETFRESLIAFYDEPILNLEDFCSHVLGQYRRLHVDLQRNRKMIEIVRSLQREDLLESGILDRCIRLSSVRE